MEPLTKRALAAVFLFAVFLFAACSSGGDQPATGSVTVSGAWARSSAPGQSDGVLYFEVEPDDDDVLIAVGVPAAVADHAELHEEIADDEGRMTMREITGGLVLPGGDTTVFEPGGLHVMLVGLAAPLAAGGSFDATFEFERADAVTVAVTIAESAP